ncbi:MAG: 9-O-acetylesterase [Cyclobacteriaceae bacterium]|nr:MAG: 9-O-acetylesterase [Cyclobacteriaceae bacterium]
MLANMSPVAADISLPQVFGDNMVLQQNSEVTFWGWANPRENVKLVVSWDKDTLRTVADNQSHWELKLPTPSFGGPYSIYLIGYNSIILENIMIGEVWLCSGQSNMEWKATSGITNAQQAIAGANFPQVRFLTVDHRTARHPQIDFNSSGWSECTPETMKNFSAVAYFFARRVFEETGIPVGLINSSWGGTPAEAWTAEEVYTQDNLLMESAAKLDEVPWGPVEPGRLYNSMIAPMTRFRIAGTIWYQGEGNTANADTYQETFSALINNWRDACGYDFPFYYAQIAPFPYGDGNKGVKVRDAQRRTLQLSNTGMVVLSDIGDTTDIHPRNKEDVGLRLANLALKHQYGVLSETVSSPLYSGFTVDKDRVTVSFRFAEGLHTKNKKSELFELAGADGNFYPAKATVKGEQVILRSKQVKVPRQVRYAWGDTAIADLFNQAGLPASSFSSK